MTASLVWNWLAWSSEQHDQSAQCSQVEQVAEKIDKNNAMLGSLPIATLENIFGIMTDE